MGKPDNDEIEREAGAKAIMREYGSVIGEQQAKNIAYHVLMAARVAKFDKEREAVQVSGWPCMENGLSKLADSDF